MLAREFCKYVKEKLPIRVTSLQSLIKENFGYHVPYHRAWDSKRKAVAKVFGDWDESYKLLGIEVVVHGEAYQSWNTC